MKAARVLRRCNVSRPCAALLEYSLWLVVIAPAPSFAQTTARPPSPALDSSRLENSWLFRAQREDSACHLSKRQRLQIRKRREASWRKLAPKKENDVRNSNASSANYKCKFARQMPAQSVLASQIPTQTRFCRFSHVLEKSGRSHAVGLQT